MQHDTKKAILCSIFGTACLLGGAFGGNAVFVEQHADECRASWTESKLPPSYIEQNMTGLCPNVKKGAYYMMFTGLAGGLAGLGIGVVLAGRKPKDPSP